MRLKGDKICVSQTSMNRLYHGTHAVWEVLRIEGAYLVVEDDRLGGNPVPVRLPPGQQPSSRVVAIDVPGGERYPVPPKKGGVKFTTTVKVQGEPFRVKEARVAGLPTLIVGPR